MPQTINTNLSSLTAQRNSSKTQNELSTAINRLSSGLRINSAKDDAAGLAITERFTAQIRGLNQAARNANDGISLAQVAEGALGSTSANLQRIRELAIQSANATNSNSDRIALQQEVAQLIAEIDRVGVQTQFNGLNLLDGTFSAQQFQVGANANQTIQVSGIASARASALGQTYGVTATGSTLTAATGITAAGQFTINGTDVYAGAAIGGSAKDIAAAINARNITGVQATALATTAAGTTTATAGATAGTATLTINGIAIGLNVTAVPATDRANTLAAINANSAATGVIATDSGAGITLTAVDGRNITSAVTLGTATNIAKQDLGLGTIAATAYSSYNLAYTGTSPLVIAGSVNAAGTTGLANASTPAAATGTAIAVLDISTVNGANAALASIDAALTTIAGERAKLGAIQNRFSSTIENLQTSAENQSAARSRIQDADFAAETAMLSRAQVLQQAGTAMIAQANQLPQQVLQLLRS
jgi:flagellin